MSDNNSDNNNYKQSKKTIIYLMSRLKELGGILNGCEISTEGNQLIIRAKLENYTFNDRADEQRSISLGRAQAFLNTRGITNEKAFYEGTCKSEFWKSSTFPDKFGHTLVRRSCDMLTIDLSQERLQENLAKLVEVAEQRAAEKVAALNPAETKALTNKYMVEIVEILDRAREDGLGSTVFGEIMKEAIKAHKDKNSVIGR